MTWEGSQRKQSWLGRAEVSYKEVYHDSRHFWFSFKQITFQKQMNTAGAADILLGHSDKEKTSAPAF